MFKWTLAARWFSNYLDELICLFLLRVGEDRSGYWTLSVWEIRSTYYLPSSFYQQYPFVRIS